MCQSRGGNCRVHVCQPKKLMQYWPTLQCFKICLKQGTMPCQQRVGICKSTTFHPINKIMVLWCGQVIFFPIVDVGIVLCNLLMNCWPHGKGSRNLPQQRRRGETTASQCDQILPSIKLSQPRWSLSRNTIIRLTLLPYTQFAIAISP